MVTRPMDLLGINVPPELAKEIYANTTGRPELLQFCCSELLRSFEDNGILPDAAMLQEHLHSSVAFAERVVASFLSSANEIEKQTCRLLAARVCDTGEAVSDYSFGLAIVHEELTRAFGTLNWDETDDILTNLVLLGAIVKTGGDRFRFAAPILAEFLAGIMRAEVNSSAAMPDAIPRAKPGPEIEPSHSQVTISESARHELFVSYTQADLSWAQWIAWTLENLGHSVVFQVWDFVPGTNFILKMQDALQTAGKLVLVLSDDYLKSSFASSEWAAVFRTDPRSSERRVLPIRVRECRPTGLLGGIVYLDLVGRTEAEAARLLTSAFQDRQKPLVQPGFPRLEIAPKNVPFPGSG